MIGFLTIAINSSDNSGWKVGDEIILATTDYSPYLNDRVTIAEVHPPYLYSA